MELKIQRRGISVYGICPSVDKSIYVGRWERGSAVEVDGNVYKAVDYGWLSDCLCYGDGLYAFGYYGLVLEGLREIKRVPMIGKYAATDGKSLYVTTENALSIYDYDMRLLGSIKLNGVRDVTVKDGVVYVLGESELYVLDNGKPRPVYKIDRGLGITYYILPTDDLVYISALSGVVALDVHTLREKTFSVKLARSIATIGDYLVSLYDNSVVVADRTSLSVFERRYVPGLTAGFAKARAIKDAVLTPVYFEEESAVLVLMP